MVRMQSRLLIIRKNKRGFTLVEVLIALLISSIILTVVVSLYTTSAKTFQRVKDVSDSKEIAKDGMARLEWLFQRWGTSTPCTPGENENTASCTRVDVDCRDKDGKYTYPPSSSVCITILDNNPDEVIFYANLYGNGFVYVPGVSDTTTRKVKSCRLSKDSNDNCYHIKRGARFILDQSVAGYHPLIVKLDDLTATNTVTKNLDCTDGEINDNATVAAVTKQYDLNNNITGSYTLEGGEVILRVPHLVRLYCKNSPKDNNKRWLYMDVTDMASRCNASETEQPLIPVNSFNVERKGEGVVVTMQVRGTGGKVIDVQRYFGR